MSGVLHRLKRHPHSRKKRKRFGRGPGSGHGKTSGRGHKGAKQHNRGPRPGFEGGQMPLIRTVPKRGFTARSKARFQVLNVGDLERVSPDGVIDAKRLFENRLIDSRRKPIKILGDGDLKKPLHVKVHAASRSALEKIQKAGGKCELLAEKR